MISVSAAAHCQTGPFQLKVTRDLATAQLKLARYEEAIEMLVI